MNKKQLIEAGYTIQNGQITSVKFGIGDHECLTFGMWVEFENGVCGFDGRYNLGVAGSDCRSFHGSAKGIEYLLRIMEIAGAREFSQIEGQYIRGAFKEYRLEAIGHIIADNWLNPKEFFEQEI